jgi:hypothetical protein
VVWCPRLRYVLPGPLGELWAGVPRPVILPLPRSYPDRDGFGGSYPSDHTLDPGVSRSGAKVQRHSGQGQGHKNQALGHGDSVETVDHDREPGEYALALSLSQKEGFEGEPAQQGRHGRGQGGTYFPLAPHQHPTEPTAQYLYDVHEHGDVRVPHQPPPAPASRHEGQGGVGMHGAGPAQVEGREAGRRADNALRATTALGVAQRKAVLAAAGRVAYYRPGPHGSMPLGVSGRDVGDHRQLLRRANEALLSAGVRWPTRASTSTRGTSRATMVSLESILRGCTPLGCRSKCFIMIVCGRLSTGRTACVSSGRATRLSFWTHGGTARSAGPPWATYPS